MTRWPWNDARRESADAMSNDRTTGVHPCHLLHDLRKLNVPISDATDRRFVVRHLGRPARHSLTIGWTLRHGHDAPSPTAGEAGTARSTGWSCIRRSRIARLAAPSALSL